jgi:hypothetical protein
MYMYLSVPVIVNWLWYLILLVAATMNNITLLLYLVYFFLNKVAALYQVFFGNTVGTLAYTQLTPMYEHGASLTR